MSRQPEAFDEVVSDSWGPEEVGLVMGLRGDGDRLLAEVWIFPNPETSFERARKGIPFHLLTEVGRRLMACRCGQSTCEVSRSRYVWRFHRKA